MDQSLTRFIWTHTRREQTWVVMVVLVSLIPYYLAFDLPKRIVNGPIQGQGFESEGATELFMRISPHLPWVGEVTLFPGISLHRMDMLMALSGTFLLLVIINGLFKFYINTYKGRMGERLLRRIRYQLIDRILRFPPQQFRRIKPAEAASMIKDEVEPLGGFTGDAFVQPVMLTGQALMAMIFICVQNMWLGAIAGGIAGIQVAIIPRMRRRLIELGRQRQLTARQLSGRIGELMEGISTIHAFDTTNYERADMSARLGRIFKIRYDLYQWKFMVKFLNNFLAQITPFIFYAFGGYLTIMGELDVGQLIAVINAYKDLPGPLKELIDWDQARQDVTVKYEQVSEQFRAPLLIDEKLHDLSHETGRLGAPLAVSGLMVQDEGGEKLLDRISLSVDLGETVALIDDNGTGAETLAAVLGRAVWPNAGRMAVAGHAVKDLPEHLLGRRISYISSEDYFFHGSLGDNLLYGLRHAPYQLPKHDTPSATRNAKWELTEARASGNADYPVGADWLDRDLLLPGPDGKRDLDGAVLAALRAAGLETDVMNMGLRAHLNGKDHAEFKAQIVQIRHRLQEEHASGKVKLPIEHFDPNRYNPQVTVGGNLLFGEIPSIEEGAKVLRSDFSVAILRNSGLSSSLFDMGYEMAQTIIELLGDAPEDDSIMGRLPFVKAREIPELRQNIARNRIGGVRAATWEDRLRLIRLSLSYVEPQMRMGLLSQEVMDLIVQVRKQLATAMPDEVRAIVTPYDPETYNDAARVIDNILFGRIGRANPEVLRRIQELLIGYLEDAGIAPAVLKLGLAEDIGLSGRRLNQSQRQRLSLARALIRQSEYYVMNKALSAVDVRQHEAIVSATLQALHRQEEKPAIIWVLSNPRMAGHFQRVVLFDRGSIEFDGSFTALQAEQRPDQSLVFT